MSPDHGAGDGSTQFEVALRAARAAGVSPWPAPGATRRLAAEALRLREWSLRRLLAEASPGGNADATAPSPAHATPPPAASPDAWWLFLRQERCAALLQDSLRRRPPATPLDPAAAHRLGAAATAELLRILSARAQLLTVARIAAREGWRIVVLKGAADVAAGLNVLVSDADVWAEPAVGRALSARLDELGFVARQEDGAYHLQPRTMEHAVHVEVHHAVLGFPTAAEMPVARAVPIAAAPPLWRLAGDDHAWTVLCQAVLKHPDRRTRTRDLLMLRRALDQCDATARARLAARIAQSGAAAPFDAMLRAAEHPVTDAATARLYLLLARTGGRSPEGWRGRVWLRAEAVAVHGSAAEWRRTARLRATPRSGRSPADVVRRAGLHAVGTAIALFLTADARLLARGTAPTARGAID